jgi:hypothetical protein
MDDDDDDGACELALGMGATRLVVVVVEEAMVYGVRTACLCFELEFVTGRVVLIRVAVEVVALKDGVLKAGLSCVLWYGDMRHVSAFEDCKDNLYPNCRVRHCAWHILHRDEFQDVSVHQAKPVF